MVFYQGAVISALKQRNFDDHSLDLNKNFSFKNSFARCQVKTKSYQQLFLLPSEIS